MNSTTTKQNDSANLVPNKGLWGASFQGLLWTQSLTVVNDNVFRWFVIGVGKDQFAPEDQATLLVVGSSFFIIPYILFASVAGWLAEAASPGSLDRGQTYGRNPSRIRPTTRGIGFSAPSRACCGFSNVVIIVVIFVFCVMT